MEEENVKYRKVINLLRRSKPELKGTEAIEENVIRIIRNSGEKHTSPADLIETIFAWTYIGWVRRSLVTASVLLVLFFVYQQTMILKGVNEISKKEIKAGDAISASPAGRFERQLMMLKLSGRGLDAGKKSITEDQLEQLIESYNELQDKYSSLVKIIEEDPELKAYIDKKLGESNMKKTNL